MPVPLWSLRRRLCAAVAVAVCLAVWGCGAKERPEGTASSTESTWRPGFVDPGTDLFAWDEVDVATGASPRAEAAVRAVLADLDAATLRGNVIVDYPLDGSVFPPELCPPTFLWHDTDNRVNAWLIDVAFEGHPKHVYAVTSGVRRRREIDPRCTTETNVWTEPAYEASARAWRPDERAWSIIKQRSIGRPARVCIYGLVGTHGASGTRSIVSHGGVTITTSKDPVGAQIFYRDVPLMPSETEDGHIKPLVPSALPLIAWRLRDLSSPRARIVMRDMPTCANCHSFSADGRTLAMDMDGPTGDKGAHVVKTVSTHMVIESNDVFTWNSFGGGPEGMQSFGLFPQVSPDGRHIVATVHESVYVQNYMDWKFLQTFYPTRGILAVYSRETGEIRSLPGADDERYVQSNATWSPDGKELVFIRAEAKAAYATGTRSTHANDPNETQIQYDLYRIPFNDGRGGTAEPVKGASGNGWSHSFPRFTPDGKWIVFVRCRNGLLMRPDGKLFIMPAAGGEAREMTCNTPRMNSHHSFSPNGRWMVFASKWPTPYTQMYLTHVDEYGNDSPAVLIPNSTAANRAVNLPEFAAIPPGGLLDISTPAAEYRRHLDRAKELAEAKRWDEALAELKTSLALRDDYADTHFTRGNVLVRQGKLEEALPSFRTAIRLDPHSRHAWNNLGIALVRLGRAEEGIRHLRKALAINPRQAETQHNLGIALSKAGQIDEAQTHFAKAVEADPGEPSFRYEWGRALARAGRLDEAMPHLAKAVELKSDYTQAWHDWGTALAMKGRLDEAVVRYRRALECDPRYVGAYEGLGTALTSIGRFDEAVRCYRRALEVDAKADDIRNSLAGLLATAPDDDVRNGIEALRHAETACANTDRRNPNFLLTLAAAQAEVGRFDDAIQTAALVLELARQAGNPDAVRVAEACIAQFRQKKPIRLGR